MSDTASHLMTMGIGVILGMILSVTAMMMRDIWREGKKGKDNHNDW